MYQAVTYVLNMCGQQESGNYIIRTANGNESLLEYTCTDPECTHCYSPNNIVCSAECSTTNVLTFPSSLYASFDQSGTYVYVVPDPDAVGGCSEEFIGYTVWNGDNRQCGDSPCCQLPRIYPRRSPLQHRRIQPLDQLLSRAAPPPCRRLRQRVLPLPRCLIIQKTTVNQSLRLSLMPLTDAFLMGLTMGLIVRKVTIRWCITPVPTQSVPIASTRNQITILWNVRTPLLEC